MYLYANLPRLRMSVKIACGKLFFMREGQPLQRMRLSFILVVPTDKIIYTTLIDRIEMYIDDNAMEYLYILYKFYMSLLYCCLHFFNVF